MILIEYSTHSLTAVFKFLVFSFVEMSRSATELIRMTPLKGSMNCLSKCVVVLNVMDSQVEHTPEIHSLLKHLLAPINRHCIMGFTKMNES